MSAVSVSAELANWISERANQISDQTLSVYGRQLCFVINAACDVNQLDEAGKLVQQGNYAGAISDAEVIYLATLIQSRRPLITGPGTQPRSAAAAAGCSAGSFPGSASDLPIARRRAIAGGGSAVPARCLTICDTTTPRASAPCYVSSPLRSSVRASAMIRSTRSPPRRVSAAPPCRQHCMRRAGSATSRSPSVLGAAKRTLPTSSASARGNGSPG